MESCYSLLFAEMDVMLPFSKRRVVHESLCGTYERTQLRGQSHCVKVIVQFSSTCGSSQVAVALELLRCTCLAVRVVVGHGGHVWGDCILLRRQFWYISFL